MQCSKKNLHTVDCRRGHVFQCPGVDRRERVLEESEDQTGWEARFRYLPLPQGWIGEGVQILAGGFQVRSHEGKILVCLHQM